MPFDLPPPVHCFRTPVVMRLLAKTDDANLAAPVQDYSKKVPSVSKSDVDTSECVNNFETQFLKDLYREAKTIFADFQALRVPHNALRAFHYFENAHRMDDFEIAVTNII
jgi:hypothetical protein